MRGVETWLACLGIWRGERGGDTAGMHGDRRGVRNTAGMHGDRRGVRLGFGMDVTETKPWQNVTGMPGEQEGMWCGWGARTWWLVA